jgi:hypothetical protein
VKTSIIFRQLALILLTVSISAVLAACSVSGQLYPVAGPMAKVKPLPVLTVKIDGVTGNSGPAEIALPGGEICRGKWSVVAPRMVGGSTYSGTGQISSGLDSAFISTQGHSFVNVGAPGTNKGQAMLVGDRGTVIECAFVVGSGTASGYGAAKDSHGNTYKLIF